MVDFLLLKPRDRVTRAGCPECGGGRQTRVFLRNRPCLQSWVERGQWESLARGWEAKEAKIFKILGGSSGAESRLSVVVS